MQQKAIVTFMALLPAAASPAGIPSNSEAFGTLTTRSH